MINNSIRKATEKTITSGSEVYYCRALDEPSVGDDFASVPPPKRLMNALDEVRFVCSGFMELSKTITYFFKIIRESGIDQHSMYRETFWKKYLDAGFISQGWLILAPKAEEFATKKLGVRRWQFGSLHKTRRIDPFHAVLLMRLDHLVIAEWGHSGKCRIWLQSNLRAPALFQPCYGRSELTDYPDLIQQHYFSAKGLWQKDLAAWMRAKAFIPDCQSKKN